MSGAAAVPAVAGAWPQPRFLALGEGHHLLQMLRPQRPGGTIVQLIAASAGEGTSSVARDLALVAAQVPGLRVLLLDLDPPGNGQLTALRRDFPIAIADSRPLLGPPADVLVHQTDSGGLCVSETRRAPAAGLADVTAQFAALRAEFGLVLIDSPPIERSYSGIVLAPQVDTNLLVVEAERTRSLVARSLRDRIAEVGGSIRGVVLNKRRLHVPRFIYRHV